LRRGRQQITGPFKGASVRLFKLAEAHNYLFGVPLRQRDPFNVLYFHFDVIAFDHDFVTWNAFLRWRPQTGLLQLAAFSFRTIKYWSGFAGDF
jgi:hypothetical protein